jgi:hypothetical protein
MEHLARLQESTRPAALASAPGNLALATVPSAVLMEVWLMDLMNAQDKVRGNTPAL